MMKKFFEREFGIIGLWYDNIDKYKIFSIGFLFVVLISLTGIFFDLSITNVNYNKNKSEFLQMEANQCLVGELSNNNNNFWMTISVIGEFSIVTSLSFLYTTLFLVTKKNKLKLKHKVIRLYSSLVIFIILIMIGIMHFYGGLTWLI